MADELPEITVTASRPPASQARQPRGLVRLNGTVVPGWIDWHVVNNSYYEADTFRVIYAASMLPTANDANWFSRIVDDTFVEVFAGFPANAAQYSVSDLTSLIYGRIDDIEYDPVSQLITLTGRDLTGAFIDAKIADSYQNQTSSQIATMLAKEHGLTPNVTATKTLVGNYYNLDTVQAQAGLSEWDLLARLARQEGFVVVVRGQTLYFGPDQKGTGNTLTVIYQPSSSTAGSPVANVIEMSFSRSQTVVKGISVTVQSAGRQNPTVKKSYPVAPKAITPGKSSPYGATTNYTYNMPAGATPFQVQARAEAIYNEIIQHAMKIKVRMPGDVITTPESSLVVSGTGTAFDQTYFPRAVTRSMSVEGFVMDIDAQNTSPNLSPADV